MRPQLPAQSPSQSQSPSQAPPESQKRGRPARARSVPVESRTTVRFAVRRGEAEFEREVLRMSAGPLPEEVVRPLLVPAALGGLPVKVALKPLAPGRDDRSARAPFLLAELPASISRAEGVPLLERALESALAVARGRSAVAVDTPARPADAALRREQIEAGLAALGWPFRLGSAPEDADVYRVTANAPGSSANGARSAWVGRPVLRIEVCSLPGGSQRVVATSAVAYGAPHCARAIERFALAANGRLRLARVGVAPGGASLMRIACEACVIKEIDAELAVAGCVEAVAHAHAATSPGLTALGDAQVARAFLDLGW